MEKLQKDVLILIATRCDVFDTLSLCLTSKKMYEIIWNNQNFWRKMFQKDFPDLFNKILTNQWKSLYKRVYSVKKGNVKENFIFETPSLNHIMTDWNKWVNPSGLRYNPIQGWSLYKDKNNSTIAYLFPSSYYFISEPQIPKKDENHPTIMLKIEFSPENEPYKISEISWDNNLLGEYLHYRRGDGRVSFYDDYHQYKFEYNGGGKYLHFKVYQLIF